VSDEPYNRRVAIGECLFLCPISERGWWCHERSRGDERKKRDADQADASILTDLL
jgi:hypothetical protein